MAKQTNKPQQNKPPTVEPGPSPRPRPTPPDRPKGDEQHAARVGTLIGDRMADLLSLLSRNQRMIYEGIYYEGLTVAEALALPRLPQDRAMREYNAGALVMLNALMTMDQQE